MDEDDVTHDLSHDLSHDATDADAYAEGDPNIEDLDPAELQKLADRIAAVHAVDDETAKQWAALELFADLYGDNLEII